MMANQQDQARAAFTETAEIWQRKSESKTGYSLIRDRNAVVLAELSRFPIGARLLDIGCGTGQLVVEAAKQGYYSKGIDYSESMIKHCVDNAVEAQVAAEFENTSIFDASGQDNSFDLISAIGLIEYIPQTLLDSFFHKVDALLASNGKLLLGTRNRLFNVTSLNEFTSLEIELKNFDNLVRQAIAFQSCNSPNFEFLGSFAGIEPQPESHPHTEIDVDTRFQYSPGEIYGRMEAYGYQIEGIYPIHYHAFPPGFKQDHLSQHQKIAQFVQLNAATDLRLVPWCSTLIFAARRST